jgi:hypothetical protein
MSSGEISVFASLLNKEPSQSRSHARTSGRPLAFNVPASNDSPEFSQDFIYLTLESQQSVRISLQCSFNNRVLPKEPTKQGGMLRAEGNMA